MLNTKVYIERKKEKKGAQHTELSGMEPVSSVMIRQGRQRWFGHGEHKDDLDWININGITQTW